MSQNDDFSSQYSLLDIEDLLKDTEIRPEDLRATSVNAGGSATDQYVRPGTFLPTDVANAFLKEIANESLKYAGGGATENILQNFLSRIDRHGTVLVPLNNLNYGYTFITRPRLNLTGGNLRQHPVLSTLYTDEKNSVPFMIRALLDTRLCNGQPLFSGAFGGYATFNDETMTFMENAATSGLIDVRNPFFTPLCNGLKGISGFPDFNLESETTEGDFHSGDFTFVKGSDMNNRTQELSLEFRDCQGSVILSCIYFWCLAMALQAKGVIMAYPDDIYAQRLNYTVSIYRFVMDSSRRNILWWAKATGCFPKSVPVGALFNINQGEVTISSAQNFSIPFVANKIEVNDPGILLDFNKLMQSYCPNITSPDYYPNVEDNSARYNFMGLPYIESTRIGLELKWKTSNYYSDAIYGANPDGSNPLDVATENAIAAREEEIERMKSMLTPVEDPTTVAGAVTDALGA